MARPSSNDLMVDDAGVGDEPALDHGRLLAAGSDPAEEPALTGSVANPKRDPHAGLGNEPALVAASRGAELVDYGKLYKQYRAETTPWSQLWRALLVLVGTGSVAVLVLVVPTSLAMGWLAGGSVGLQVDIFSAVIIGLVPFLPGLVWIERSPWTIPNRWTLMAVTGLPIVVAGLAMATWAVDSGRFAGLTVAFGALIIPGVLTSVGLGQVWSAVHSEGLAPVPTRVIPFAVAASVAVVGALIVAIAAG